MSNLAKIFNPPASRDLTDEEVENCGVCQVMATVTSLAAGGYFASGLAFKGEKPGVNPAWWKALVRLTGYGLIGFGIYRGIEPMLTTKTKLA